MPLLCRSQVIFPKDMGIMINLRRKKRERCNALYLVSLELAMFKVLTLLVAARL